MIQADLSQVSQSILFILFVHFHSFSFPVSVAVCHRLLFSKRFLYQIEADLTRQARMRSSRQNGGLWLHSIWKQRGRIEEAKAGGEINGLATERVSYRGIRRDEFKTYWWGGSSAAFTSKEGWHDIVWPLSPTDTLLPPPPSSFRGGNPCFLCPESLRAWLTWIREEGEAGSWWKEGIKGCGGGGTKGGIPPEAMKTWEKEVEARPGVRGEEGRIGWSGGMKETEKRRGGAWVWSRN